jgi:hypothetical protein
MIITTGSNVGINNASPSYRLDIDGSSRVKNIILQPSWVNGFAVTPVSPLALVNGGGGAGQYKPQIEFQYEGNGYNHYITSTHDSTTVDANSIDFWLFKTGAGQTGSSTPGTGNTRMLSVQASGIAMYGNLNMGMSTISNVNLLSTNTIRAGTVYASFIGDGSGITGISGSGVTNILSTNQFFVSSISTATIQTSNIRVGTISTNSYVSYPGLAKQYSQSILAEQETGTGLQEMLIFRGSSASDRIRLQTTGYIVFETGVGARVYPTITSNATPSWMIDVNGCVGVGIIPSGTANKLDVAGQGRFQTLSTTSIQAGSMNLSVAFV